MSAVQATQGQSQDGMVQLASTSPPAKKGRSHGDAVEATRQGSSFLSSDAQSGLRKRKRIRMACRSCRARKQRCDGQQPKCSHCKLQKLDCCYESASQKAEVSQLYVHNLLMRIENLEEEVEAERSRTNCAARGSHRDGQPAVPISTVTKSIPPLQAEQDHETLQDSPNSAASDFAQQPPIRDQGSNKNRADDDSAALIGAYPTPESLELPVKCCLGPTSTISFLETLLIPDQEQQQQPGRGRAGGLACAATGVDMASQPISSQTFAGLSSLADSWPQRHLGDYLVECYMNLCYPQYPFLHGPTIQERYESIWTAKERQSNLWMGTINIVFALGCQFCPDISPHLGQEFFKKAMSLIDFDLHRSGTLETLQALILMSLYLQSTVNLEHSWNIIGVAVRQAQGLGLHLSNTYKPSWTPLARETRKRAWWACYVLDMTAGIMLGRPQMISDDHPTWVDLPAMSDGELSMNSATAAPPGSCVSAADFEPSESWTNDKPSELTFFVATIRLCGLMREVIKVYDCPSEPSNRSRVLDTDDKLCEWIAQFSPNGSPEIESSANKKFWRHRQVLISRFLNLRIVLHRPCVLQDAVGATITPYNSIRSVAAARLTSLRAEFCTNAASEIIEHISKFYAQGLNSAWWYDANYLFSASTVLLAQMPYKHHRAEHYRHLIGLAVDVMEHMQRSGKALAGEYLSMLERLKQQVAAQISSPAHNGDQHCPQLLHSSNLRESGVANDGIADGYNRDAETGHVLGSTQFDAEETQGMTIHDSLATLGEIDWNASLESLSFPWNLWSDAMLHNDDIMACFPGSMDLHHSYNL